jgi:thiamine kinase-like enzyme
MLTDVITQPEQATPEWLTGVLKEQGYLKSGRVTRLEEQGRHDMYALSIALAATYSDEVPRSTPTRFFLKMTQPDTAPLNNREVLFYTQIAPAMAESPSVHCYHAAYDLERGVYHVLLEDLSETHYTPPLALPPTRSQAAIMVDTIAKLHAFWWDHPDLGTKIGIRSTAVSIQHYIGRAADKFPRFADFMGDRLSKARRQMYELAFARHPDLLITRVINQNHLTFVHGDVHVANFLFPHYPEEARAYLIDWHTFDFEPQCWMGAADLAYMICHYWFRERRQAMQQDMLHRYYERLQEHGVTTYSWDEFWYDYRLSAIISLYIPVLRSNPHNAWNWYPQFEKATSTFEDLNCAELLN